MNALKTIAIAWLITLTVGLAVLPAYAANGTNTIAYFDIKAGGTPVGQLTVELFNSNKPETVRNFLSYVQTGAYSNVFLHRCVSNFVVQGGGYITDTPTSPNPMVAYTTVPHSAAITNEYKVGAEQPNSYGTLAMARPGGNPDSATSEWFFNLADNSASLGTNNNGGYTVFGRVIAQTNSLTGGTNLLDFFGHRSKEPAQGIVDLTSYFGTDAAVFSDLPVNYNGAVPPRYADLFMVEIRTPEAPDAIQPIIAVDLPGQNSQTIVSNFTARGTASDNIGVAGVQFRVNGGAWGNASGSNVWTANVSLIIGTNVFEFRSVDLQGNPSVIARRTMVFAQDSMSGTYTGLFYETNIVAFESAGLILFQLSDKRSYTATLTLAGVDYKLKGQLNGLFFGTNVVALTDSTTNTVVLPGTNGSTVALIGANSLAVEWVLNPTNSAGQLLGQVRQLWVASYTNDAGQAALLTNTIWTSPLLCNRAVYAKKSNSALNNKYTLQIERAPDFTLAPGGSSYAYISLDKSGSLNFKGILADDETASQRVFLGGTNGAWPLYVSLYNKRGAIIGWLNLTNLPAADISGTVTWLKKAGINSEKTYPNGFTNSSLALGAIYEQPGLNRVLNFTNGIVVLMGAGLTSTWTNTVLLKSNNGVQNTSTNQISVNISPGLGQFGGNFTEPGTGEKISFSGSLNRKLNVGFGYFINEDTDEVGFVYFGP